ncbi:MAG TPA: low temperature-induced protein [Candidatus Sericytochromatia bacterium]|jgi:hypothetical protein|nr:low temperature-induced protein [Cyanobacteriota bacterium]
MKSIQFNLSALFRSMRLFVAGCVCALMLFSNALPAYSLPNPFAGGDKSAKTEAPSDPTKGEDKLLGIEAGGQKTVNRSQDLLSGEEVTRKSNEGINEVQGAADIDKMKRPSNSQGETIEGILQEKLEEATGQK